MKDKPENQESATEGESKTLRLSSVFNIDGINVLGAFTDEQALFSWAKQPIPYKMLESKDVIKLCEETTISRIVINSGLPTMFVLEKNVE
ncbi:SseB family protein [Flavobacterium sp. DG1-102-2]|uniref:SseB family protein n=1 Tax=Flavobacterium sp. DG1-102-2 TaxID=3081663 RepID=UPI0029499571|nr:SseB family protein [Flavobacterium sp. DG1-102-2]MDV6168589.1 SseB family protein [Flavobacterium sp. DG1-102-2]